MAGGYGAAGARPGPANEEGIVWFRYCRFTLNIF